MTCRPQGSCLERPLEAGRGRRKIGHGNGMSERTGYATALMMTRWRPIAQVLAAILVIVGLVAPFSASARSEQSHAGADRALATS